MALPNSSAPETKPVGRCTGRLHQLPAGRMAQFSSPRRAEPPAGAESDRTGSRQRLVRRQHRQQRHPLQHLRRLAPPRRVGDVLSLRRRLQGVADSGSSTFLEFPCPSSRPLLLLGKQHEQPRGLVLFWQFSQSQSKSRGIFCEAPSTHGLELRVHLKPVPLLRTNREGS